MSIVVWHGESVSLFYVVDDDDDVLVTFHNRDDAERFINCNG